MNGTIGMDAIASGEEVVMRRGWQNRGEDRGGGCEGQKNE